MSSCLKLGVKFTYFQFWLAVCFYCTYILCWWWLLLCQSANPAVAELCSFYWTDLLSLLQVRLVCQIKSNCWSTNFEGQKSFILNTIKAKKAFLFLLNWFSSYKWYSVSFTWLTLSHCYWNMKHNCNWSICLPQWLQSGHVLISAVFNITV